MPGLKNGRSAVRSCP